MAGYLLARGFRRLGWHPDRAWSIVVAAIVLGFVGGKLYSWPGTQPQLWSALLVTGGVALLVVGSLRARPPRGPPAVTS